MKEHSRSLRWFSSLFVAAIGLHELRYLLGPGADAQHALGAQAHSYLPLAAAFVALLFGASVVHFISSLALARSGEVTPPKPPRFKSGWLVSTLGLVAIFVAQESFEGALVSGHSSGLHGLFGHGGWVALLLAPVFAALVTLFVRGAQSVIVAIALRAVHQPARRATRSHWPRLPSSGNLRPPVLACNLAGRAPPGTAS